MRRRERAITSELRLNVSSDEKLSSMSPIFTHRMVNLSPIFQMRSQDYLVCVFATIFVCIHSLFCTFKNIYTI